MCETTFRDSKGERLQMLYIWIYLNLNPQRECPVAFLTQSSFPWPALLQKAPICKDAGSLCTG